MTLNFDLKTTSWCSRVCLLSRSSHSRPSNTSIFVDCSAPPMLNAVVCALGFQYSCKASRACSHSPNTSSTIPETARFNQRRRLWKQWGRHGDLCGRQHFSTPECCPSSNRCRLNEHGDYNTSGDQSDIIDSFAIRIVNVDWSTFEPKEKRPCQRTTRMSLTSLSGIEFPAASHFDASDTLRNVVGSPREELVGILTLVCSSPGAINLGWRIGRRTVGD